MLHLTPFLTAYLLALAFLFGACMGSFLNCFAWRFVRGESISRGRSRCPDCAHILGVLDLIPIFSFLASRGACRHCGSKISPRYVLIELLCATAYAAILWQHDFTLTALRYVLLASLLLVISLIDWETYEIPNRFVVAGIGLFFVFAFFSPDGFFSALKSGVLGGLSISLPLFLVVLLADKITGRETMGGGDIKLIFMIGLHFHWTLNLLHMILACFVGLSLGAISRRGSAEKPIPFAPAIALAALFVMLFGAQFVDWYLKLVRF